jgi:Family of unknown function (DUF6186)
MDQLDTSFCSGGEASMHISTSWGYFLIFVVAVIVTEFSHRNPEKIAPFLRVADYSIRKRVTRTALLLVWWWLGWHFLGSPYSS